MLTNQFSDVLDRILPMRLPDAVKRPIATAFGLSRFEQVYSSVSTAYGAENISSRLLSFMDIRIAVADQDLARIPRSGPAIVIANHPYGVLDGAVLHHLLTSVRTGVKLLANGVLNAIPELRNIIIDVDPIAGPSAASRNLRGIRQAFEHLAAGGIIVIFPAGEVSHFQWKSRSVTDSEWNNIVPRLVSMLTRAGHQPAIVPMHISGRNSPLFQAAGLVQPRLRTALLAREMINKRGRTLGVRIGNAIGASRLMEMPDHRERNEYLRWRTYLLAQRAKSKASTQGARLIRGAVDLNALEADVTRLNPAAMLASAGDLKVYIATAHEIPNVLAEIGRLRELTFRAAGEGTGNSSDTDRFDTAYLHLFLWHAQRREVAGAYRLAATDQVPHLYTQTLFDYTDEFLHEMGPALELGRSFIRPEYQRSFNPLFLLWKGIGRYVARHPRYRMLFGPVSISNEYQCISRRLMVRWLEHNASLPTWKRLVSSKRPFRAEGVPDAWISDIDELAAIVADVEPDQRGVPILLRQYLKLGGKLLAFNVDPNFSNTVDGLIVVNLQQTEPRLLARYLGAAEAAVFLKPQKETYAA